MKRIKKIFPESILIYLYALIVYLSQARSSYKNIIYLQVSTSRTMYISEFCEIFGRNQRKKPISTLGVLTSNVVVIYQYTCSLYGREVQARRTAPKRTSQGHYRIP